MIEKKMIELKNETQEINEILFLAQESLKVVEYLLMDEKDDDKVYVKKMNAFFGYTTILYWRVIVIELSKLLSNKENDHYNIKKFISKLKRDGYYGDANIDADKITKWESTIASEKNIIKN